MSRERTNIKATAQDGILEATFLLCDGVSLKHYCCRGRIINQTALAGVALLASRARFDLVGISRPCKPHIHSSKRKS